MTTFESPFIELTINRSQEQLSEVKKKIDELNSKISQTQSVTSLDKKCADSIDLSLLLLDDQHLVKLYGDTLKSLADLGHEPTIRAVQQKMARRKQCSARVMKLLTTLISDQSGH